LLRTRLLSALVLIPIVGWAVWLGGWWLLATVLLAAGLAGYEFSRLMRRADYVPSTVFILATIGMLVLDAQFPALDIAKPGLAWILLLSISWQLFQSQRAAPTADWALTMAGGLYIGWLSAHMIRLRALPDGLAWTALALLVTWGSDTAAYFVGNAIGRRKLWPRLSPHKTWEGVWGGTAGGLLAGAAVGYLAMQWSGAIGPVHGLCVGLLAAVVGPFGDLAISMMKRQAHVKDSGHIIPGHGGFLDRTDSLMFVVVATYYYAVWFGG
jgi:phosphatidate cytidylyltransferase